MRGVKIISSCMVNLQCHQFFFPRRKKELPSGIGTIFSFGPENSGFNGATPAIKKDTQSNQSDKSRRDRW